MSNTALDNITVRISQTSNVKVRVQDNGSLQSITPVTLKNAVGQVVTLTELFDVTITDVANSQILAYQSNTGQWINRTSTTIAGNTGQVVVANTDAFNFTLSLANTVTINQSLVVGNTTVNTVLNSTTITTTNVVSNGVNANTITSNLATFNTSANVGANVQLTTSQLSIGNATVNTIITSTNSNFSTGKLFVDATNSRVGINNTTPDASLSVTGTANVSGNMRVGGTLTIANTFGVGNTTITGFANVVGNLQVTDTITGNNMTLSGNLTVSGTTTYINTTALNVGDNIVTLNADVTNVTAPTENAGIEINRGSSANVSFLWNETGDYWDISNTNVTGYVNASSVNVTGAATVNGAFTVNNTAALGNTTITGFANVVGNINITNTLTSANLFANALSTNTFTTNLISVTTPATTANIAPTTGIAGWNYSGKFKSIAAEESAPTGLFLSPDGLNLYVNGSTGDDVNQYTLSTAFDVSTATFVRSFSTGAQDSAPADIFFKPDGLSMFVVGTTNDTVFQYTLSSAFNISTAFFTGLSFSVISQDPTPLGLWFKPDGTVMYMVGSTTDTVYQYTLGAAWNVASASYAGIAFSVATQESGPTQVNLSADGLTMWILGSTGDDISQYALGTAFNVSTAVFEDSFYFGFQETAPNGLFIDSTAANRVYLVGQTNDIVYQYNTVTNSISAITDVFNTANNARVQGNLAVYGNVNIDGTFTVQGTSTLGTTNASSLTVGSGVTFSAVTSNLSLGASLTSGTWIAGGTSGTGTITLGRSTVSQTTDIQAGATASGSIKTLNIGTAGLSGSITNLTLGSSVSGATTNTLLYSNTFIVAGGNTHLGGLIGGESFRVIPTVNSNNYLQVAGAVTGAGPTLSAQGVDANVGINITAKGIGVVNISPTLNVPGNATVNGAFVVNNTASVGNTTITGFANVSTTLSVGANVIANTTALFVGNSTVNATHSSSLLQVANSTSTTNVSANGIYVGGTYVNSSAVVSSNAVIASAGLDGQVAITDGINGGIELGKIGRTVAGTPYIDFHSSASSPDYDVRIIASGGNTTSGSGNLSISANVVNLPNTVITGTIATGNVTVTGFVNATASVNSAILSVGTAVIANSTGITTTGFVNATASVNSAILSVGTAFIANSTGAYHTGTVNAASHTVSTNFIANSTGITTTGFANVATTVSVGANVIANTTSLFVGNSTVNTVITQTTAAFNSNSTFTAVSVAANGNVGIGDSSPTTRLLVNGAFRSVLSGQGDYVISHSGLVTTAGAVAGVQLALTGGGTEAIRITTGANVGIGNTTPNAKLQVTGTANVSGLLTLGGNTAFNGNSITYNGTNTAITMRVLPDGILSFEGGAGQLFSIANSLTGQIFSVNDISGIPSIEVYSNGQINMARFGGNVAIGSNTTTITVNGAVTLGNTLTIANNLSVTGFVNATASVNSAVLSVGTSFIANTTGAYHTGTVNATSVTVGTAVIANSTGVTTTGFVNATASVNSAILSVGTAFIANSTGITTTGFANVATTISVGANVIANTTAVFVGNSTVNTVITQNTLQIANATVTSLLVAANGNVGIGNSAPGSKLVVAGNARIDNALSVGGSNILQIDSNSIVGGRLVITVDPTANGTNGSPNSNVGIGNTAPTHKLRVEGNVSIGSSLNVATTFASGNATITGFANVSGNLQVVDTIAGNNLTLSGNLTVSGTTTYINTTTLNVGDNIITLNADLGAVAPTENAGFEVNRGTSANVFFGWNESGTRWEANTGNSAVNELRIVSNTYTRTLSMSGGGIVDSWGSLATPGEFATFTVAGGVNRLRTNTRNYIIANTANDLAIFAANGNVGIGNMTPANKFNVQVTSNTQVILNFLENNDTGTGAVAIQRFTAGTDKSLTLYAAGGGYSGMYGNATAPTFFYDFDTHSFRTLAGTTQLYIASNTNVGIGNSTPTDKLRVEGTASFLTSAAVGANVIANTTALFLGNSTVNTVITQTTATFNANSTATALFVAANGNVGIGNTTPGDKVTIEGNVLSLSGNNASPKILILNRGNNTTIQFPQLVVLHYSGNTAAGDSGGQPVIELQRARGSLGATLPVQSGDVLGGFNTWGSNSTAILSATRIHGVAEAAFTTTATAGLQFFTTNAGTQAEVVRFSANGNVGIGNTAPAEKLVVNGNILANNLRRFTANRTLSVTANDTVEIGTLFSAWGAHSLDITIQGTESGFSTAKQYRIVSLYNATGSTVYRKVIPSYDTGPFSSNDFDLEAYHFNETIGLRVRRIGGSVSTSLEIVIEDMALASEGVGSDYFTPSSTTASGVAAVTDIFPGARLTQTGVSAAVSNSFIVQANLTTAAITSNNTSTAFNLPVSFNNSVTIGYGVQFGPNLTTSATTANQVLSTVSSSSYRSAKFLIQVTSGSAYQLTEITLIHDGTNVYKTEYGQVFSGAVLATFDADINSGNMRLLTTPTNAVTVYKGVANAILV